MEKQKTKKENKGYKEDKISRKTWNDAIITTSLTTILLVAVYLISSLRSLLIKHIILIFLFSFFVAFITLLTKRALVVPIILFIISLATMETGIFSFKNITLFYIFSVMSALFLACFYILKLLTKRRNAPIIAGVIIIFSLMPLIESMVVSFRLTEVYLYEVINLSLMNFLISFCGVLIAAVVCYRLKITRIMLKMGYLVF